MSVSRVPQHRFCEQAKSGGQSASSWHEPASTGVPSGQRSKKRVHSKRVTSARSGRASLVRPGVQSLGPHSRGARAGPRVAVARRRQTDSRAPSPISAHPRCRPPSRRDTFSVPLARKLPQLTAAQNKPISLIPFARTKNVALTATISGRLLHQRRARLLLGHRCIRLGPRSRWRRRSPLLR